MLTDTPRLQEENELIQFFSLSSELFCILGFDGYMKRANPRFTDHSGYSEAELMRTPFLEFAHKDDRAHIQQALRTVQTSFRPTRGLVTRCLMKNGAVRDLVWSATPTHSAKWGPILLACAQDVTIQREVTARLKESEARAIAASKMASLGEMASGIAHEINNPLAVIVGRADRILNSLQSELDIALVGRDLEKIQVMADRIARIVRSLRSLARDGSRDPFEVKSVRDLVYETVELCRARFQHHYVDLRIGEIPADLSIECRAVQISQVLLNLLNNAFDAVRAQQERWILIECRSLGPSLLLQVSDSGHGVASGIREKIMDPFFTTKPVGEGTGLGLSIARAIVADHRGILSLDQASNPTRFLILLPHRQEGK